MKFRKKPVVIEAYKFDGGIESAESIRKWAAGCGVNIHTGRVGDSRCLIIPTLEGDHQATEGDMIIKGVKNEFYPCKSDIFEATYEEVTE